MATANISAELIALLKKNKLILSTAESCTGGLIAKLLTDIPGASNVFVGSLVAYSNNIKRDILNVKQETLDNFGAVSHETVKAMAENINQIFKTDVAISVSGIAGPGGETEVKKVGTVCFGFAFPDKTETFTKHFQGSREHIRTESAIFAISYCKDYLNKLFSN